LQIRVFSSLTVSLKKSVVRVHYGEGVAIHIGPESCAGAREGIGEALTGERIGQAIERERRIVPGADDVRTSEGKTAGYANRECPDDPAWSQNTLLVREPGDLTVDQQPRQLRCVLLWSVSGR
jgi:hypothetical protein